MLMLFEHALTFLIKAFKILAKELVVLPLHFGADLLPPPDDMRLLSIVEKLPFLSPLFLVTLCCFSALFNCLMKYSAVVDVKNR